MADIPGYIENYGLKKFLRLSARDQNKLLYSAHPNTTKSNCRNQKNRYLSKLLDESPDTHLTPKAKKILKPESSPSSTGSSSAPAGGVSILNKALQSHFQELPTGNYDPLEIAKLSILSQLGKSKSFIPEKYILENPGLFTAKKHEYTYIRPPMLNPKQHQIIDCMCDQKTKVIFVEGDRRTGKSTAWITGAIENIFNGDRTKIGLWAATEETCNKIHRDAVTDNLTWDSWKDLVLSHTAKRTRFRVNGGIIETHATKMSDASGLQYDIVVIDEFHQVLRDNAEAFATIAGITRSEPNLKIVLVCNKGQGAYEAFKDELKPLIKKGVAKFFTLEKKDTTHITEEADEISDVLMRASMGDDFADSQLKNITTHAGDPFPPKLIIDAMNGYDEFMEKLGQVAYFACVGVDPGFSHPTGVFVMGVYRGHIFELESMELAGKDTSDERVKAIVSELATDYGGHIVCESNSGGLHWIKAWNEEWGHTAYAQNFAGPQTDAFHRMNMIRMIRDLMTQHRLHICSRKLKKQLLKYNPDKDKNDSKGDLADAFIHAAFYLIKNYIGIGTDQVVYTA